MLNKEVCKKCFAEKHDSDYEAWDEFCDRDWEKGVVWCWFGEYYPINITPPEECPYKLEHIVMEKKC